VSLVLIKELILKLASLGGLFCCHLLGGFLSHLTSGLLRFSFSLSNNASLSVSCSFLESSDFLLIRSIRISLGIELLLSGLLELLKSLLLILNGVQGKSLSFELLLDLFAHFDFSSNTLIGFLKRLILTLCKLLSMNLFLELCLFIDLNLLGLESIDLSIFLGFLSLTFIGSFTLFGNAFFSSLLLTLDSFLSTFVGVLLTDLCLNLLFMGVFVDGIEIGSRRIIVVAIGVEDALVRQKIIPVIEADSFRCALSHQ
jgi:hypothetical protein